MKLHTLILTVDTPIAMPPEITDFSARLIDDTTLEVDIYQDQDLNSLFDQLSAHQLRIKSMRNKSNRLEQLFLDMVDDRHSAWIIYNSGLH